jgi:hypothetical protein
MRQRWRTRFPWIAIVAALSNALLPSAFAVGNGRLGTDRSAVRLGFCSAIPARGTPTKTKPALIVHHCALCASAQFVLSPSRQAGLVLAPMVAGEAAPLPRVTASNAFLGHSRRNLERPQSWPDPLDQYKHSLVPARLEMRRPNFSKKDF